MRIALDATYSVDPRPSGIAVYSQELLAGLAAAYPDDRFIHCYRPKQMMRAGGRPPRNVRRRVLLPPFPTFRADLFHALNQRVDKRPAGRVVCTFHDLFVMTAEYSSREFRVRFTEQARRAAAQADMIIAVSEFTARQTVELLGFDRSRIRVVPHGVKAHPPAIETPAFEPREKLVLFVGALQIRKNAARLVRAFEQVSSEWRLVLAGSPHGYRAADVIEQIEKSSCRERIRVTGYVCPEELERLYARASIFAFPSLDEGFGIPVLEAMAHGLPVVTSNRPALAEIAGDAALLVNPEDTDDLAQALRRLIDDSDLRARLAHLGRARSELFPWERSVEETYRVYREMLS